VIVPCYNRAQIISETLDSVWSQTYRPIELIMVDDGSTDDVPEVIKRWAANKRKQGDNSFTTKIIHQKNSGPSSARNTGLLVCKGEYIQFLDSDDILHEEKFEIQTDAIKNHHKDFCVCNYKRFEEYTNDKNTIVDFYSQSHSIDDFPLVYPMDTPAPLYKRHVVLSAGLWRTYIRAAEDFEYNFRILSTGAKGIWLDCVLLYVRKHNSKERIQSSPLRARYRFMYHGLAEMELEAMERGICTRKLLNNLGFRALMYYEAMRAENDTYLGKVFLRYAKSRLSKWRIVLFIFKQRVWKLFWRRFYPKGPRVFFHKIIGRHEDNRKQMW